MQTAANDTKRHESAASVLVLVRALGVTVASLAVGLAAAWILGAAWISARSSVAAPGPASADEVLALAAATLAVAIAGWLALGTVLEVLSHVPGRVGRAAQIWADRLTPALGRRIAAFVLGVGVGVAGGPTQAVASPRGSTTVSEIAAADAQPTGSSTVADPGFVPTRPTSEAPATDLGFAPATAGPGFSPTPVTPAPGFTPPSAVAPVPGFTPTAPLVRPQADPGLLGGRVVPGTGGEIVVHRGDTLWSIAARHLGPQASDAEIAQAWPRWFDLNRDVIGSDADLILPGQILRVPGAEPKASVTR